MKPLFSNFCNFYRFEKIAMVLMGFSVLVGCSEQKKESEETGISGRFVNETFLQAIPDSVPGLVPAYCYELNFISPDTVEILYGFEEAKVGYKKSGDGFVLIKAIRKRNLY